jgi:hypothetical protein
MLGHECPAAVSPRRGVALTDLQSSILLSINFSHSLSLSLLFLPPTDRHSLVCPSSSSPLPPPPALCTRLERFVWFPACTTGTTHLRRVWADAGRGHDAYVQRLPCSEAFSAQITQSEKDGFEKSRIGREPEDGVAQGYLRSAQQVARHCQRRCATVIFW